MAKPRGAICNLDCEYCFYLSKKALYPDGSFRMSDEVLETYVRQYIEAQGVPEANFAWQGGEPTLMGLDFFRRAVAYQDKYRKPGMRIENALQTNGTLLDDEWCRFFKEHGFLVGISLDGPRALHDVYRKDKGGAPTFDRVMKGLSLLRKHEVDFNILACVSAANVEHPLEVYRFLRDEAGAEFIQFIPIVERQDDTGFQESSRLTSRSISGEQYGEFLIAVFDEWVRCDVGRVFVQMFDTALGHWLGAPGGLCVFAETCGLALAMEHNGDLYACDHFVEPRHYLGNVTERPMVELVASPQQRQFGLAKRESL
ncbi:MAG: anaerobic sulfatase maturase, partial [Chloroflexota bacterium]|nr:anaerobic sulfatase maturase [Chloroflexota bacterium]